MKEFFDTLFKSSKERIKNPLIVSFLISWSIYNWNCILILFYSDLTIEHKIEAIKPKDGFFEPAFWLPLFFAIFYVVGLPLVLIIIDKLTDYSFQTRKKTASNRRVKELNNSIEIVIAEVKLEKLRTEFKDVSQLNDKITKLEEYTNHLESELNASKDRLVDFQEKNTDLNLRLTDYEAKYLNSQESARLLTGEHNDLVNSLNTEKEKLLQSQLKNKELIKKLEALEKKKIVTPAPSNNEFNRIKNRLLLETKTEIDKEIVVLVKHFVIPENKSINTISIKLLSSLDKTRDIIENISIKYSKYKSFNSELFSNQLFKIIDNIEDNLNDNSKRIIANIHTTSSLQNSLYKIFAPILDQLSS